MRGSSSQWSNLTLFLNKQKIGHGAQGRFASSQGGLHCPRKPPPSPVRGIFDRKWRAHQLAMLVNKIAKAGGKRSPECFVGS
eukprot:15118135-Alexandrium_andersonii.AAC.1